MTIDAAPPRATPMKREAKNAAKRQAILDAALEVFSARGFAAARVEDIARAARVAKGTIYLHFADKEDIFSALAREVMLMLHQSMTATLRRPDLTIRQKLWRMAEPYMENNGLSRTGQTIRLIQAEGLHNPDLVREYRKVILSSVRELQCQLRAVGMPERLCAQPQLFMSPIIHGIVWQGMMGGEEPMNMAEAYRLHLDALLGAAT